MKVMFMLPSLHSGGMERQLSILAKNLHKRNIDVQVLTFFPGGSFVAPIKEAGIEICCLKKNGFWDILFFWRLFWKIRKEKPDVIYTYMPFANIISALTKKISPNVTVVWATISSFMELKRYSWLHKCIYTLERMLSKIPDVVVSNTSAGAKYHIAHGYQEENLIVIPSGIDVEEFTPRLERRNMMRLVFGLSPDCTAIGIAARLDPIKNHPAFFKAASILLERNKQNAQNIKFVCIGYCDLKSLKILEKQIENFNLTDHVIWTGHCEAMDTAYATLDIATSSTRDTGFPNAVAEAMSCAVPCVALKSGDNPLIVGDTGIIVEPDNPEALAEGWQKLLNIGAEERHALGLKARTRIEKQFSVDALTDRFLIAIDTKRTSENKECVG